MEIRNKIRMTKKANFSKLGLTESAKVSLNSARREANFDPKIMDMERDRIVALYDDEENDIFFIAIKNGWHPKSDVELIWAD